MEADVSAANVSSSVVFMPEYIPEMVFMVITTYNANESREHQGNCWPDSFTPVTQIKQNQTRALAAIPLHIVLEVKGNPEWGKGTKYRHPPPPTRLTKVVCRWFAINPE